MKKGITVLRSLCWLYRSLWGQSSFVITNRRLHIHRTSAESYAPDSPDLAAAYLRDQRSRRMAPSRRMPP